ncbi:MAG: DUF6807 family protein [Limisphaerales bacterium]|jgi:hypothetical protein
MKTLSTALITLLTILLLPTQSLADWKRTETTLAWTDDTTTLWQFSFDPAKGKPFFHPLAPAGKPSLTNFRPADHPWHYALWFSWKYIDHPQSQNHINYWEENSDGKAQGRTRWEPPSIETQSDGSATIRMNLSYIHPSGKTALTEQRDLAVSTPAPDGSYTIHWTATFTAADEDLVLDRTPMPNDPRGQVNGGYAGLSARMAPLPATMSVITTSGPIEPFTRNRARPKASAVACNFTLNSQDLGSLTFCSHPDNTTETADWYIIDSQAMPFICQAILAPEPKAVPAKSSFTLRYQITVSPTATSPAQLQQILQSFNP